MNGAFSGVDGMEVERLVDVMYTDIVKARKMLDKMNMKACADIANEVGRQIEELQPHVPFIMGAFFMIVPYFTSVYICLHLFTPTSWSCLKLSETDGDIIVYFFSRPVEQRHAGTALVAVEHGHRARHRSGQRPGLYVADGV